MTFVVVANLDDLEVGDIMLVEDLREPICLIRLDDDDVRAIHNTCTHLTSGEAVGPFASGPAPLYACKIEDDAILVDIDQQLNDAPIPQPPLI
jgi:3-phenylpropionate/trans-cinnamate dioxygenase ferredoxin subunit